MYINNSRILVILSAVVLVSLGISALLSFNANASLVKQVLTDDVSKHGYVGSPLVVTVYLDGVGVSVNIDKGDAYDLYAIGIVGDYDTGIHKWRSLGSAATTMMKDFNSLTEAYSFTLLSESHSGVNYRTTGGGVEVSMTGTAEFQVDHRYWFLTSTSYDDYYNSCSSLVPYDALNRNPSLVLP